MENIKIDTALLSEVLEDVNEVFEISEIVNNSINVWYYPTDERGKSNQRLRKVNLGALAIDMMNYIKSKNLIFNLYPSSSVQGWVLVIDDEKYIKETILEVVYKATEYVYKQAKD